MTFEELNKTLTSIRKTADLIKIVADPSYLQLESCSPEKLNEVCKEVKKLAERMISKSEEIKEKSKIGPMND
jgi:hypothetical protein